MEREISFPHLGDAWLDNGLEVLFRALKEVEEHRPNAVKVSELEPDRLRIKVLDLNQLVQGLGELIGKWVKERLFYSPSPGEERAKGFVVFRWTQPPKLFDREKGFSPQKGREILKEAFSPPSKGAPCPICGQPKATESLTQSVYPLSTKIRSLSGVRTRITEEGLLGVVDFTKVCPRCYLRGAMAWLDDGLIYRTGSRKPKRPSFVILPSPPGYILTKLFEVKKVYRGDPRLEDGWSNVKVVVKRATGEREEDAPGGNSLLLAFLERLLEKLSKTERRGFWEASRKVSEGWMLMSIPMGLMKNVTTKDIILDEPKIALLSRVMEEGFLPYADMVAPIWLFDQRTRKSLPEETDEFRERMAKAILGDDFSLFASFLIPRPRQALGISKDVEGRIEKLVLEWRCGRMDADRLEVVKKAGRALGQIAFGPEERRRGAPTLLYALERARSPKDLLSVLEQACHRLLGLDPSEELKYLSLEGLDKLTEIVNQISPGEFGELKSTLMVFASLEWARKARQAAAREGGEGA